MKKQNQLSREKVKEAIQKKFKSIARFSKIAEREYKDIQSMLRSDDPQRLMELQLICNCTWDRPLLGELSRDQKLRIRDAISRHGKIKLFCKEYNFDQTWMSRLLSDADYGAVRSDSPNLKRLLKILNLEL